MLSLSLAASSGNWDSYGCTTVEGDRQTHCRCNHLTYFAVLMVGSAFPQLSPLFPLALLLHCLIPSSPQVSSPEITYVHREYLSIITYIGCLISALASICTIFFLYFRYGLGAQVSQWADRTPHAPSASFLHWGGPKLSKGSQWSSWKHNEGARLEESRMYTSRNYPLCQVS